jgi:pimeloyl-ACP methyl ester carboxylesterase
LLAADYTARLGEIRVPTLVLHGRDDQVVPYDQAAALHDGIEGARLVCLPGDHLFFRTGDAERVGAAVRDFTR